MFIFPYPKPTRCYGDTVIRRQDNIPYEKVGWLYYLFVELSNCRIKHSIVLFLRFCIFFLKIFLCFQIISYFCRCVTKDVNMDYETFI